MSAIPSRAQSELYQGLLPIEPAVEPPVHPTILENERSKGEQPSLRKRASRALTRFLIAFCIGVTSTLAWQSYGDGAREIIVNSHPKLGWLVSQAERVWQSASETIRLVAPAAPSLGPQPLSAISVDLDAVRQNMDRIASNIAAIQEQMSRSDDRTAQSDAQLTTRQQHITREITELRAIEQYVLYKNTEPPPRPAPAPAPAPVHSPLLRSSQAR
jgi:hypothetical protein